MRLLIQNPISISTAQVGALIVADKPKLLLSLVVGKNRILNMISVRLVNSHYQTPFLSNSFSNCQRRLRTKTKSSFASIKVVGGRKLAVKGCSEQEGEEKKKKKEKRSFLTLEEAGLVEISGLSTHERFLCRLTISSLNLLRVISEQEGCAIEELNAGRICDWFVKDKLKREQNIDSAILQWDDSDFLL